MKPSSKEIFYELWQKETITPSKMTENSCSEMRRDNLRKPNSWRLGWTMHVDVPNYYYQFLKPIICRLKFFMWEFSFLKATTHQIKILSYKSTPYIQIPIYWAPKNYTEGLEFRQIYKKNICATSCLIIQFHCC